MKICRERRETISSEAANLRGASPFPTRECHDFEDLARSSAPKPPQARHTRSQLGVNEGSEEIPHIALSLKNRDFFNNIRTTETLHSIGATTAFETVASAKSKRSVGSLSACPRIPKIRQISSSWLIDR